MKQIKEPGEGPAAPAEVQEVSLSPFAEFIGARIDRVAKNYCRLSLVLDERCTNYYGGTHGGVIAALADNCMGMALRSAGLRPVTVELTVNYMSNPDVGEKITAEGLIIHQGNTIVLAECIIKSGDLKNVARGKGVFLNRGPLAGGKDKG
ncbi:PaaI family thioesterase [Pelotomaculum propionicicum]|uniref:PaaI family thioesterase n=1 Tax=Pelotomaculum propionicicum TaxID=258475 RepID=UPI003B7A93CB